METTFITIHDLSRQARILYSSDSIVDILGHTPDEVVNRSAWDFFHPDEIPLAKDFHSRGVKLDKAAVLAYCQIRNRQGEWVGCECCFSVVYDVMVCCTSVYRRGMTSQKRAVEAPVVRKLFTSSPKDPRYHMLSHLSSKFDLGEKQQTHEPRAALFLNRFTRTLTIMYATSGIEQVIGIPGEEMKGKSFYYCIQEGCLEDAVRCLEQAKGNDSIAYLRFWFRDPRPLDARQERAQSEEDTDESMTDVTEDEEDGGVNLRRESPDMRSAQASSHGASLTSPEQSHSGIDTDNPSTSEGPSRTSSGESGDPRNSHAAIFGQPLAPQSSASSPGSTNGRREPIELEAVVSCTSDGLVVCLRRARPTLPTAAAPQQPPAQPNYANGIFAAPWAHEPVFLPPLPQPVNPINPYESASRMGLGAPAAMRTATGGPMSHDLMQSIRDVAVFAWALTGINGSLAEYSRGKPKGESQPPDGFPVWAPSMGSNDSMRNDSMSSGSMQYASSGNGKDLFGDPGLGNGNGSRYM
ncbi:hypothetical protein K490DRAFT_32751 [Saccharata proteae CBS 121410]|uniref:PAS domain-containing protein n=1 Tax=Saccharata proteae CBS 121410 TaxID=1314787 RepID=A0A9P4I1B6_9PEZI|nr:hypothetical protein K490DRAFT_32751 [Saccharata proteae CBS 121410]